MRNISRHWIAGLFATLALAIVLPAPGEAAPGTGSSATGGAAGGNMNSKMMHRMMMMKMMRHRRAKMQGMTGMQGPGGAKTGAISGGS